MDDAGLHHGQRENRTDGLWKALQPIDDGDQDVTDAAALEFIHDAQPELGAFGLLDPQAQNILGTVGQDTQRDVDRLVAHGAFIADLDPQGIEEHQRIGRIERPVLPFRDLVQYGVGHGRDQIGRNVEAVNLLKMAADLAHAHAAGVHQNNLVVEIRKPALILGDQLWIEGAGAVARNRQVDFGCAVRTDFLE